MQPLNLPNGDEAQPIGGFARRRVRLGEQDFHLGDGGLRLVERAGEQPREFFARPQIVRMLLEARVELRCPARGGLARLG